MGRPRWRWTPEVTASVQRALDLGESRHAVALGHGFTAKAVEVAVNVGKVTQTHRNARQKPLRGVVVAMVAARPCNCCGVVFRPVSRFVRSCDACKDAQWRGMGWVG